MLDHMKDLNKTGFMDYNWDLNSYLVKIINVTLAPHFQRSALIGAKVIIYNGCFYYTVYILL